MKYKLSTNVSEATKSDLIVLTATSKDDKATLEAIGIKIQKNHSFL